MFEKIKSSLESKMNSSLLTVKSEMGGIRAGRASPSMLDSIKVDAYGQKMNINQLGNITTPDSRTINVDVWDQSTVTSVDKALRESDLGINPIIEGSVIRLPLPQLTEERRAEYLKMVGKISETSKIAMRNIRRDGIEQVKKLEKDKAIGQDDSKKFQEEIDKITSTNIAKVDDFLKLKEEELKKV
jgi:ribosome recycling factor|tara:strand:+ start:757 stop:1314 length:558 start_codon:yes stop_codon:yes gene_type:complete